MRSPINCTWLGLILTAFLTTAAVGNRQVPPSPDTKISPGDLLAVNIYELLKPQEDYAEARQVAPDGQIRLPLLGQVDVQNLTARESRDLIERLLVQRGVTQDPQVRVDLRRTADQLQQDHPRLSAGDNIIIRVFELERPAEDYNQLHVVGDGGTVHLPGVGQVQAADRRIDELESLLAEQIEAARIVRQPYVRVIRGHHEAIGHF